MLYIMETRNYFQQFQMKDEKMIHAHGGIRRKIMEGNKKPLMGVVVNCMSEFIKLC